MTEPTLLIRPATEHDVPLVHRFICDLAEYEKRLHEVVATEEAIRLGLFGPCPYAEVLLAFEGEAPAGFALFFHNFSTFLGKPGIYLEDLFVRPEARRRGIGKRLFAAVARVAVERGCGRLEWSVLTWNEPAIRFYKSLGGKDKSEWTVYQVAGKALEDLAAGS